jgi:stringent starvation protein B
MKSMTSNKPYLIRALYEWIADNNMTPYITINTNMQNVVVPQKYIQDGKIVLNISQKAVRDLRVGNDALECSTRFSSKIFHIYAPVVAITAIFAQETGRGMIFPIEKEETGGTKKGEKPSKPHLTLVK